MKGTLTTPHEVIDTPILVFGLSDVDMLDIIQEVSESFLLDTDTIKVLENEIECCTMLAESYPLHYLLSTDKSIFLESHRKSVKEAKNELLSYQDTVFADVIITPPSQDPVLKDDDFAADFIHAIPSFNLENWTEKVKENRDVEIEKARMIVFRGSIKDLERIQSLEIDPKKCLIFEPTDQYLDYYHRLTEINLDGFIFPNFGRLCRDGFVIVTETAEDELPLYNISDAFHSQDANPLAKKCCCSVCSATNKIFVAKMLKICPAKGANFLLKHNIFQIRQIFARKLNGKIELKSENQ